MGVVKGVIMGVSRDGVREAADAEFGDSLAVKDIQDIQTVSGRGV